MMKYLGIMYDKQTEMNVPFVFEWFEGLDVQVGPTMERLLAIQRPWLHRPGRTAPRWEAQAVMPYNSRYRWYARMGYTVWMFPHEQDGGAHSAYEIEEIVP